MRALLLLSLAAPSLAFAQTIDFEALETPIASFVRIDDVTGNPYQYVEDGFVVDDITASYGFYRWGLGTQQYIDNGSTNMYNNGPDAVTRVSKVGGGTFGLLSIDLAELNGADRSPVNFVGTRADGSVVTHSVVLDGVPYFAETFTFPSSFQNLVTVEWVQESPYHTFDNIVVGGGFQLDVDATCPGGGAASLRWTGASPNGRVALVRANSTGSFTVPSGGCAGTRLGLSGGVSLIGIYTSTAAGNGNLSFTLPAGACGKKVQALDLDTCTTSGVSTVQ
jgi:hypothetical protein